MMRFTFTTAQALSPHQMNVIHVCQGSQSRGPGGAGGTCPPPPNLKVAPQSLFVMLVLLHIIFKFPDCFQK